MENEMAIANKSLIQAVEVAYKNNFSREDWEKIKECLQSADPDCKLTQDEITVLMLAVKYANKDLFNFLVERRANVNATDKLGKTALYQLLLTVPNNSNFNEGMVHDLLKYNADPNIVARERFWQTPIALTAYYGRSDLVKLLIQYKADVNQDTRSGTALALALYRSKFRNDLNLKTIKELCDAGASLLNVNRKKDTIFHLLVGRPIELIETFLTYARFDGNSYKQIVNQVRDKEIKERIMEMLVFLRSLRVPEDLQFHILSKLPIDYFYDLHSGLCKELVSKGYQHPYISAQVNKRVDHLRNILAISNKGTALEKLHKKYPWDMPYKQEVEPLFDGSKLEKDMENFLSNNEVSKDNLIYQMYYNCTRLLDKDKM